MSAPLRIGIIGDFEPTFHSHFATNAAVYDAAVKLKIAVEIRWLSTPSLDASTADKILGGWDGIIASPGSPYKRHTHAAKPRPTRRSQGNRRTGEGTSVGASN